MKKKKQAKVKVKAKVKAKAKKRAQPRPKPKKKAQPKPQPKPKKKAKPKPRPQPKRPKGARRIDFEKLSLRQAIARLGDHLRDAGYDPVLIGASCAAIYAGPSIKPKAIDFVVGEYQASDLDATMGQIGFRRMSMNAYECDRSPYDVVFAPPPLAVGDDVVRETAEIKARPGTIRLLNPTDCVRHRLSMFYRWGDRDAFSQAIEVASRNEIDMELVRRWSEWEWCSDRYEEFVRKLEEQA